MLKCIYWLTCPPQQGVLLNDKQLMPPLNSTTSPWNAKKLTDGHSFMKAIVLVIFQSSDNRTKLPLWLFKSRYHPNPQPLARQRAAFSGCFMNIRECLLPYKLLILFPLSSRGIFLFARTESDRAAKLLPKHQKDFYRSRWADESERNNEYEANGIEWDKSNE